MRSSMTDLVAYVRLLIADTAGASQVFSNEELQQILDNWRQDVYYQTLSYRPTIVPGGTTTYLTWAASVGWWEDSETLCDSDYAALTAASSDRQRGVWTFAATQATVLITGSYYDVYGAAADAVGIWASKVKLEFDFSADNAEYKRSQKLAALTTLMTTLRSLSASGGVNTAQMIREDVTV